jgi:uncharacterized 2Fe-2S/4Fe-4S cluster protein (DUF4445 family)
MNADGAMIIFQPSRRRGEVPRGITLVAASRILGADIEALCGEKRGCGKCIVQILDGFDSTSGIESKMTHASPWQEKESRFISPSDRKEGFRLGCVAKVMGDLIVFVPESSLAGKPIIRKTARFIKIDHNPAVRPYHIQVESPSSENPTSDLERICQVLALRYGLKDLRIDLMALRQLPNALRRGNWTVTVSVWMGREIIRVQPGKGANRYGLAIDIGTTSIAGYLCDLSTMAVIDTITMTNPQIRYGEDVMSRIAYLTMHEDGLQKLSDELISGLNRLVGEAIEGTYPEENQRNEPGSPPDEKKTFPCLTREDIEDVTIGCNTAMHHILLGLDPRHVGLAPFPPVVHRSLDIKARDIGLRISPGAYVYILPIEAGFVGADNVGVLLSEEPYNSDKVQLIIDIGTNGELVLGNSKRLISCSCATGPALEGSHLTHGMRAAPGAIERIEIDPVTKEVDYKVIGRDAWRKYSAPDEMEARGICGSGVLDVLAELYRAGIITDSGAFQLEALDGHPRFRKHPETHVSEFILAFAEETRIGKNIVITQKDIRQIQLAKAALYAGCKLMMKRLGIEKADVVKIAGAFGTYVDRHKALIMGLFPHDDPDQVVCIGNAAGDGCRVALLNIQKRKEADWVARHVEHLDLALEPDFQQAFIDAMRLPGRMEFFSRNIPHPIDLTH